MLDLTSFSWMLQTPLIITDELNNILVQNQ